MKKAKATPQVAEMRAEYDFSAGVRGKYAARCAGAPAIVVLDSDVAELFPDSKAVNDALRALTKIADRQRRQTRKRHRRA